MPRNNDGTWLELAALLGARRALLRRGTDDGAPLDFATAFAMSPRTPWRRDTAAGTDVPEFLDELARNHVAPTRGCRLSDLLSEFHRGDRSTGPNGALVVARATALDRRPYRVWINDLLTTGTSDGLRVAPFLSPTDAPLAEEPNPNEFARSIAGLRATLAAWRTAAGLPAAVLGYLDPMCLALSPKPASNHLLGTQLREWLDILVTHAHRAPVASVTYDNHADPRHRMEARGVARSAGDDVARVHASSHVFVALELGNHQALIHIVARDAGEAALLADACAVQSLLECATVGRSPRTVLVGSDTLRF